MTIDQRAEIAAAEQDYLDMLAAVEIRQACHSAQASPCEWLTHPGEVTAIDMTANGRWVAPSLP